MVQSGGVGAALVEQFSRLGIGISSFASVGDKLDVSGTDLMLWWEADDTTELAVLYLESFGHPRGFARWEADDTTELAVLYLESFGHPRGFARTARRIGARIPVLTVHAGRWVPGQRAAASHTAAAVSPLITRQALFDQAGIIATSSFGELLNAVVLMAAQPIPAGKAVAIVSNGGGASVLAADACADAGLTVARTGAGTRDRLRGLLPPGSALDGPVVTTSAVGAEAFREALLIAAAEEGVGALIAVVVRRGLADLIPVLTAERLPVPIAAVVLGQPEAIRLLHGGDDGPAVPAYAYPEAAARALARAARYGAWRSRPAGAIPELGGLAVEEAQSIVESFIARMRGGGWLSATEADGLMRCYGIPMVEFRRVADTDAAVAAAADLGGHVVLKADVPGLLHKTRPAPSSWTCTGPARSAPPSAACRPGSPGLPQLAARRVASLVPHSRARAVSCSLSRSCLVTRKLSGSVATSNPCARSNRATPFEARPVSIAGPCIRVSKAAALTGYWPREPNHSRRPGPSASGSTVRSPTGLSAALTAASRVTARVML